MRKLFLLLSALLFLGLTSAITNNPLAYWSFDANSTTTAYDDSMNNINLSSSGNVIWIPSGKIGNGVYLDGTGLYQSIKNISLTGNQTWSVVFWMKNNATDATTTRQAVSMGVPNGNRLEIARGSDNNWTVNTALVTGTTKTKAPNNYNLIVVTYNGSTSKFYVNNTLVNLTTMGANLLDRNVTIGADQAVSAGKWNGTLDEISIWNRELVLADVSDLWNDGNGLSLKSTVILYNPFNSTTSINRSIMFNATLDAMTLRLLNITNATFYLWNSTGIFNTTFTTLSGSTLNNTIFNISNFIVGNYQWNVYGCFSNATSSLCTFSNNNNSFNWGYQFNNHTFNNPVAEISGQAFILNLSLPSGLSSSTATLYYNNTAYSSSSSSSGPNTIFSRTITTPDVSSNINITWNWQLSLTDGSTTTLFNVTNGTQQVQPFSIDNCTSNTLLALNYTLKDEETQVVMPTTAIFNSSISIQVTLTSLADETSNVVFNQTYSKINPAQVCVQPNILNSSTYRMDVVTQYSALTYEKEYHNIQNFSLSNNTIPQNINLFDLLSAHSQPYIISFKDSSLLPVEGAIIDITKQYLDEGVFKSVEIPLTDSSGQTVGHLVSNDAIYTMIVKKNGVILGTFNKVIATCQNPTLNTCRISLSAFTSSTNPQDFSTRGNLNYDLTIDRNTRTATVVFSTLDGTTTLVSLNLTRFDNYGNNTVCTNSLSSSSGTITCSVPSTYGNYSVLGIIYNNGNYVASSIFSIEQKASQIFGKTGIMFTIIFYMVFVSLMLVSNIGIIITAILALIVSAMLNLYTSYSIIGIGSTIILFIIAGAILIWKITREGRE